MLLSFLRKKIANRKTLNLIDATLRNKENKNKQTKKKTQTLSTTFWA